jgi:ADP-L-glycero-D-manno-heptose 6-epimerase
MKILVTGYNGLNQSFIPKAVFDHLTEIGHEVDGWLLHENNWDDTSETIYGWTKCSNGQLVDTLTKNDIDARDLTYYDLVIHLGAESSTTNDKVDFIMRSNFDFSLWLLNQCQKHKIPLHYASSASVYGQLDHFQENGVLSPQSPYAYSKYMFDRIVTKWKHTFVAPVIGFRYFNVYGTFSLEEHKKDQMSIFSKFERDLPEHGSVSVFEFSDIFYRDFIYIKDVCKIHEKMLNVDYKGVVNIGTGTATSFDEIAKMFCEKTGADYYYTKFPEKLKNHYQKYTKADNTILKSLIGEYDFITPKRYFDECY